MRSPYVSQIPLDCALIKPLAGRFLLSAMAVFSASATASPPATLTLQELTEIVQKQQQTILLQQQRLQQLESHSIAVSSDGAHRANVTPLPATSPVTKAHHHQAKAAKLSHALEWEGYGTMFYSNYDFFKNAQDDTPDRRSLVDTERLVIELGYQLSERWKFETEIEFEHGGTGSTLEYEPDEFGEYEFEVEKGGEVIVEKLQLTYRQNDWLNFRFGRILVPVGMVNRHHKPDDYYSNHRSISETALLPSTWHETGVEWFGRIGPVNYRTQIINGLDSSGFSGYGWVSGGHQKRHEFVNADNLAWVFAADMQVMPSLLLGGSFYIGDSSDNRPKQNLDASATVTIAEFHGRYQQGPVTARAGYIWSSLSDSDLVSAANRQTFNGRLLGVSRTAVGSEAYAAFVEAGYRLPNWFDISGKLELFARYELFDTMAETEGNVIDNAKYDRTAYTLGMNYQPISGVVIKGEYGELEHQGTIGSTSDWVSLGFGFEFD